MRLGRWRVGMGAALGVVLLAGYVRARVFAQNDDPEVTAMEQGKAAFKSGQYGAAIESLKKALAIDPDYTIAELYLGASYAMQVVPDAKTPENQANAENAIAVLKRIPEDDGSYHNAQKLLSLVYRDTGRLEDARTAELAALKVSDDAETHYAIGVIDWREATEFARATLEAEGLRDDGAGNAQMSAIACEKIKEHNAPLVDDAVAQLTRAIEMNSKYSDAMGYLNLVYRRRADFDCGDAAARAQDIEMAERWEKQAALARSASTAPAK